MARSVFDLDLTELTQLARWQPGEPLAAAKLNESVDRHNVLVGGVRVPTHVAGAPAYAPGIPTPLTAKRFRVVSAAYNNAIECREWDGATQGDTVYVAKPYTLRTSVTSRAGVTYVYAGDKVTRTATKGSDSETQLIVPSYWATDEIWAVRADTGTTKGGITLIWLDLNIDGREFKRQVT